MTYKVLREGGEPVAGTYKPLHHCPVYSGMVTAESDNGKVIECECGRRYYARESWIAAGVVVWCRRWFL